MRIPPNFRIMSNVLMLSAAIFCCISFISHPVLCLELSPAPSPTTTPQNLTIYVNDAMNEVIQALHSIKLQQPYSSSPRERGVFSACSTFFSLTIMDLNQTLQTNLNPTPFDVQIWLSSALTNIHNCITTLTEQNVTNPIFLHNINIASELITNSLVMNDEYMKESTAEEAAYDKLHRWFPDEDLLNLSEQKKENAIVVAQDGSGDFRTINEGLDAARKKQSKWRVVIYVKQGTYNEYLEISGDMKNIMLTGDGIGKTIITGDRCARTGFNMLDSSTVKVYGAGFVARDITFRNTGGVTGGQGVALFSSSDQSAFYRCSFEGYQDTLCVNANRQFYRECAIYGTIDFIFGNAAVVIQKSNIYMRPPQRGQQVVIIAQSRTAPNQPTGISILNCKVLPDPKYKGELKAFRAYLGRPWKEYSRVVYMKTSLDGMVDPEGWLRWDDQDSNTDNVYYAEYQNYGSGSSTEGRVKWRGAKVIEDFNEALNFSVEKFINGEAWLRETSVPFAGGLDIFG